MYGLTVLKLDFNYNKCLSSENILEFFKYLQNYNEFYLNPETDIYIRKNLKNKNKNCDLAESSDYYNKIKSHYIKSINEIPNEPIRYNVCPDVVMVTMEDEN